MYKLKLSKALILGVCLTLASASAVYASDGLIAEKANASSLTVASIMVAPDTPVSSPANPGQEIDPDLLKLQQQIDQFVFEQHLGEFADQGFSVTHTGPMDSYVEIGIQPYSDKSAEYLYSMFGKERVKVVEGQFASTLAADVGAAEPAPVMAELPATDAGNDGEVKANVVSDDIDKTAEISITSAEDSKTEAEEGKTNNVLLYGIGAVAVLGVGAVGLKGLRSKSK